MGYALQVSIPGFVPGGKLSSSFGLHLRREPGSQVLVSEHRKLGRNLGAYLGERLDAPAVLQEIRGWAQRHGWMIGEFSASPAPELLALHRSVPQPQRRIYLSAGIHGDEPAGPLAIRQLLEENRWPDDVDLWLCPCLNPTGFARNTRENADGIDLNRDYRHAQSAEVRAHIAWLKPQPRFDLTLCLHEDWEAHGFYVYELNATQSAILAPRILAAVTPVCPIDPSPEIDGRVAVGGVILPVPQPMTRDQWPEAIHLFAHHTEHACTLEAPSDFPLPVRVAALVAAVHAALARA